MKKSALRIEKYSSDDIIIKNQPFEPPFSFLQIFYAEPPKGAKHKELPKEAPKNLLLCSIRT